MCRSCVRTPHNGCVRSLFRVDCPPFCTMPSPVPMSCRRKSLYGWMILLPSAAGTVKAPPLITVPTADVVIEGVWQIVQPMLLKRLEPATASDVPASAASRGGALVDRMKSANVAMSSSPSSPQLTLGADAHG